LKGVAVFHQERRIPFQGQNHAREVCKTSTANKTESRRRQRHLPKVIARERLPESRGVDELKKSFQGEERGQGKHVTSGFMTRICVVSRNAYHEMAKNLKRGMAAKGPSPYDAAVFVGVTRIVAGAKGFKCRGHVIVPKDREKHFSTRRLGSTSRRVEGCGSRGKGVG